MVSAKVRLLEIRQKGEASWFCFLLLAASSPLPPAELLPWGGVSAPVLAVFSFWGKDLGWPAPGLCSVEGSLSRATGASQPGKPDSQPLYFCSSRLPPDGVWWLSPKRSEKREWPDVFGQKMEEEEG